MVRTWMVLPLLAGCSLEQAPETLDEAFKGWWNGFRDGSDDDLGLVLRGTLDVVDEDALEGDGERGTQARLVPEDLATVDFFEADGSPRDPPDPALARPVYLIERLDCTLDAYAPILVHDDQSLLYGDLGNYTAYERDYQSSRDDFLAGTASTLWWKGSLTTDSAIFTYAYTFVTEARWVPAPDDLGIPGGRVLVVRDWMPFPATTISGDVAFDQDYQLEVFVPLPEGDLLHVYPVWRQIDTALGSMESEAVASFNVGQMVGWGNRTEQYCTEGVPEPDAEE